MVAPGEEEAYEKGFLARYAIAPIRLMKRTVRHPVQPLPLHRPPRPSSQAVCDTPVVPSHTTAMML